MSPKFNADEIFAIAEQIERNGAAFYRKAAELETAAACKTLFEELAQQETDHLATFIQLEKQLAAHADAGDPPEIDETTAGYLNAMAGGYVFDTSEAPAETLDGSETLVQIVKLAIHKEEDSIALYVGMRDALSRPEDKEKLGAILQEEKKHLVDLASQIGLIG